MNGLVIYKVPFEILDGSWLRNKSLWTSLKIYGGDVDPFVASVTQSHSGFFPLLALFFNVKKIIVDLCTNCYCRQLWLELNFGN